MITNNHYTWFASKETTGPRIWLWMGLGWQAMVGLRALEKNQRTLHQVLNKDHAGISLTTWGTCWNILEYFNFVTGLRSLIIHFLVPFLLSFFYSLSITSVLFSHKILIGLKVKEKREVFIVLSSVMMMVFR